MHKESRKIYLELTVDLKSTNSSILEFQKMDLNCQQKQIICLETDAHLQVPKHFLVDNLFMLRK